MAKIDEELAEFCENRFGCTDCIMRSLFPDCGDGMNVCYTTGNDNLAAHKLMDAVRVMEDAEF